MTTPLSGTQHTIRSGDYCAIIASVGATLRSLQHADRDLVVPFGADEVRPASRGVTLAPWPNRIADGRYSFGGTDYQLPLTEPARHNAIHGLVSWLDFEAIDKAPDSVTLSVVIPAQTWYPFPVRVDVAYAVDGTGLTQTVTATNLGAVPAPYGTAPHPYLVAGAGTVDDWRLELPADEVLTVTPDRLLPIAVESVDAHPEFDFRTSSPIAATAIDHAFTALNRSDDGLATVRVLTSAGTGVELSFGVELPWVQIHTADRPGSPGHRLGLAVEPMTCPPDAFNSGTDLIVLEPGASHTASWSISAVTA
ncbi:MAG TPA: aldose 1-epimerase family protein [Microbacterium sp.]|uniref:aldose 1-epimerase family protein n=1 Tax=Microbacterium sp. TaxID=51671 RepID=UPI002CD97B73|nr:aldose 1-epimerase family protein [Microbacterium sp.]HWI31482.1 aldose 1-epimerase family protein [Microbacterium sp.]